MISETGAAHPEQDGPPTPGSGMAEVLERNIQALVSRRAREEKQQSMADRLAASITDFTGSMNFVVLHLLVYGVWIVLNLGILPGFTPFDPTFVTLAMVASVEEERTP